MSSQSGGPVKLLCVPLKDEDDKEKVRRRVLKKLKLLEKQTSSSSSSSEVPIRFLDEVDANSVASVAVNARYIVFLMKDGRVCRIKCCSRSVANRKKPADELLRKTRGASFQMLSDAEYARQLQAEFDQEREGRTLGHHPSLRSEDIYPYVTPWDEDDSHSYIPGFISNISSSPLNVPSSGLLSNFTSSPQQVPISSHHPPFDRRSSSVYRLRFNAGLSPVNGRGEGREASSSDQMAGPGGRHGKQKEELWPEFGALEWLVLKKNPERSCETRGIFSKMAVTHSEVLLVTISGQLFSWPCEEGVVMAEPHPLTRDLGLEGESVSLISSSEIRVSIVTESGKVGTFYDPLLRTADKGDPPLIVSLSHPALVFPELSSDSIRSLEVSDFMTSVITTNGRVLWWGLCPKGKTATSSTSSSGFHSSSANGMGGIVDGCLVRLKNGPPCGPGALVLSCSETHGPRVGKTVNIIEHSSLDPRTTLLVKVLRQDLKSETQKGNEDYLETHPSSVFLDTSRLYEGLEVWKQSDVIFLDDSPAVLGRVVAVDNSQAIVDIACAQGSEKQGPSKLQSSLKVFRLSEIEPCGVDVSSGFFSSSLDDTSNSAGVTPNRGISRHVAGIVQHHPACLLDPSSSPGSLFHDNEGSSFGQTTLHGFTPLAIHPTNSGPLLLVKRTSDGKAFLVSSSHLSSGLLQTSSFIAIGSRSQRSPCCTIEEEGCSALEGGLARDTSLLESLQPEKMLSVGQGGRRKKAGTKRKKRKQEQQHHSADISSVVVPPLRNTASFINLYQCDLLLLQDIHDIPIPIPPGFSLRVQQPSPLQNSTGGKELDKHGNLSLTQAYTGLVSRVHTKGQGSQGRKVLLIVAVPRSSSLMPAVLSGAVDTITSTLSMITDISSRDADKSSVEESAAKRVHLEASQEGSKDIVMLGDKGMEAEDCQQSSLDMNQTCSSSGSGSGVSLPSPISHRSLLEYSVHNNSLLHVCCGGGSGATSDSQDEKVTMKSFKPYAVGHAGSTVDAFQYQSVTANPELHSFSFEELRYNHMTRLSKLNSSSVGSRVNKRESEALLAANKLAILDALLGCLSIRNIIRKMLCQKNSFGETPFLTAISNHNYSAAMHILQYCTSSDAPKELFQDAILTHNREGMTPIEILFASLTPHYDIHSMRLSVTNIPVGFTAQQLLQLFKDFYPSAYRAEIVKFLEEEGGSGGDTSESESSSTEEVNYGTTGAELVFGGVVERARRRIRNRQRRRGQASILENGFPQKGVVYFSDIHQLRAAVSEMQDYRVLSNHTSSRGTFGQAHSVSFLNITMEVEDSDSEREDDDGIPTLLEVGHGIVPQVQRNRRLRMERNGKKSKHLIITKAKYFKPAAKLLASLLSHTSVSSMMDSYGETALCSLVHNPRCLHFLKQTCMYFDSSGSTPSQNAVPESPPPPLPGFSHLVNFGSGFVPPFLLDAPQRILSSVFNQELANSLQSSGNPFTSFWRPFSAESTGSFGMVPTPSSAVVKVATSGSFSQSDPRTQSVASPSFFTNSSQVNPASSASSQVLRFGSTGPQSVIKFAPPAGASGTGSITGLEPHSTANTLDLLRKSCQSPSPTDSTPEHCTCGTFLPNEDISMAEASPLPAPSLKPGTVTNAAVVGNAMLDAVFTSWPCVVTTVLGFCPSFLTDTPASSLKLSPVQMLDNFVVTLYLNCDKNQLSCFVNTIISKMNSSLEKNADLSNVDFSEGLERINELNLPLYVGVRFLNSVVRLFALEHSRVKSSVVELPNTARDRQPRGQSETSKELLGKIRNTLSLFSWLAVESLAHAAESANLPVRMGVSKPFGASSVVSDYQSQRFNGSSRFHPRRGRSLGRQLHIRSALPAFDVSCSNPVPTPPITGIRLVPRQRNNLDVSKDEEGGSLQEDPEYAIDFSDSDIPMSDIGNDSFDGARHRHETFLPRAHSPEEIRIDLGSSSDEDDPFIDLPFIPSHHGNVEGDNEAGFGEIYPYAWALDGRRIGENAPMGRPASPSSTFMFGMSGETPAPLCTIPSIRFGAGFLSRTFARIVKDTVDIANALTENKQEEPIILLPKAYCQKLINTTVATLERSWQWVESVLDVAEGQLQKGQHYDTQRYVALLRGSAHSSHSSAVVQRIISRNAARCFIGSTPGEYMTYLLRSQSKEDSGCLPVIDLYGYEHVVYVLDSLIYTLTNWPKTPLVNFSSIALSPNSPSSPTFIESPPEPSAQPGAPRDEEQSSSTGQEKQKASAEQEKQKASRFFERSDSITTCTVGDETQRSNELFFGPPKSPMCGATNGRLQEAFPLAKQPHLLRPNAKKEQLFSSPHQPLLEVGGAGGSGQPEDQKREEKTLPVSYNHLPERSPDQSIMLTLPVEKALQRWNTAIGVFAHIFLAEGPGSERANFLNARAGFASRMARFRHQVSQLFESNQSSRGDWASVSNTLSVRVRRDQILEDSLEYLSNLSRFHYSQIRVKFEGEDGSGPGVNRGFFASLANALKTNDRTKYPCSKLGLLFYQPGKEPEQSGMFAPLPFRYPSTNSEAKNTLLETQRLNMYTAVGRFLGLCFWFKHTIPFTLCRHVAKYLIGRELAWHDLAFFNADLYEGFRRMMLDAEMGRMSNDEFQQVYCCYFEAPLSGQTSEPVFVDLIPGGSKIPVTPDRVQEYVRLYAMFVMVKGVEMELISMRSGLTSVIPSELLTGLTAEDFQLLLAGDSANISLKRLKSVIKFNHTHGRPTHVCERFEKMFWQVVSRMGNTQRQQLLYFATGSAALPSSTDNEPSISITIDVIGSSNTDALPVASTCSQRMSIPLYPSYHTLKKKLLQAVQCQAYGLG